MRISAERISLTKRHPLTISRGTITGSVNVVIGVEHDGVTGLGEMGPSDVTGDTAESAERSAARWQTTLADIEPWEMERIGAVVGAATDPDVHRSAVRAALDMACYDWLARSVDRPVWQLLGVDRTHTPPTSVTIGIDAPEVMATKVPEILHRTQPKVLKVKLGQPAGIAADKAMFTTVQRIVATEGFTPILRVDANGGWSLAEAGEMIDWLADNGVDMVEQPLAQGQEADLVRLYRSSVLPIYADESIRVAADVAQFADCIHGVNLKLMKCGGIREALRIIHTARAHGLKVMIGCMGESSLAIAAGAQLGGLVDALDLDSHLNLIDDPFNGMEINEGRVLANDRPGLGVVDKAVLGDAGVSTTVGAEVRS